MKSKYIVTGNERLSLPTIREIDGALEGISFLHMGAKGMLELCGGNEEPFLQPYISVNGEEMLLSNFRWDRVCYWLPCFTASAGAYELRGEILAPIGERGFGYRLKLKGQASGCSIKIGLKGCWSTTYHSINESKEILLDKNLYKSGWNHSYVMDLRPDLSLFAFAPIYTENENNCPIQSSFTKLGKSIAYEIWLPIEDNSHEEHEACIWFGIGFEEVSAATSAKEMLRQGFESEWNKTERWLTERIRYTGNEKLDQLLNMNMFFSYFFGGGITLDTEDFVLVTSRSPRYYVSAAYWDRDSLLWSFPAILMADRETAREMLLYVFTRQLRNVGIHSRYIDGTVLEPGFELDELCAPIIALSSYIEETGDKAILLKECVMDGVRSILKHLSEKKHASIDLYETFLQPTDDMRVYPYITYDNVLVWYSLNAICHLYQGVWQRELIDELIKKADAVRASIEQYCVKEKSGVSIYAWSVDLKGGWDVYDEPPGSLLLLPYYGFCSQENPVWINTVDIIRRREYPYSFADCPIAEIGCPHAPHPWVLSIANSLLSEKAETAREHLLLCSMDNGIACESVDEHTGESSTGDAFATCAGFLAYAIYHAFGKSKQIV